jgi:apolipoprotein N-acyltransferase
MRVSDVWKTNVPLAALAGLTLGFTPAPNEWAAPAYVGLAFLAFAVAPPGQPSTPRRAFAAGFVCSFLINAMALYWVTGLLEVFAGFPTIASVPTASLLFAAQALPMALACALAASLSPYGVPVWLVLPPLLTVVASLSPSLFPWRLCHSHTGYPTWLQLAELGGQPLLDLCLTYAAMGLGWGIVRRDRLALAVGVVAFALPIAYGSVRMDQIAEERNQSRLVRIGVVQPNVAIFDKADRRLAPMHLAQLQDATRMLEDEGADLVVWPETAYPYPIPRNRPGDVRGPLRILNRGVNGPLLIGAITMGREARRYNSVVAVNEEGRFTHIADKVKLLAFGEYVPLWDYLPPLQERFHRGLTPGDAPQVVPIDGVRVGVLNCYEDVLDQYAILVGRNAPDVLVNVTNDAWFGDTAEPWLHEATSRLRSVETRRDLVRAVNTGTSSHTAATGESLVRTPTFETRAFVADVRVLSIVTPWVRFGDWVTPAILGALLGAVFALWRRGTAGGTR